MIVRDAVAILKMMPQDAHLVFNAEGRIQVTLEGEGDGARLRARLKEQQIPVQAIKLVQMPKVKNRPSRIVIINPTLSQYDSVVIVVEPPNRKRR